MDPFVDQLKGLYAVFPTRCKWVFVPTHAIGRTLGESYRAALRKVGCTVVDAAVVRVRPDK